MGDRSQARGAGVRRLLRPGDLAELAATGCQWTATTGLAGPAAAATGYLAHEHPREALVLESGLAGALGGAGGVLALPDVARGARQAGSEVLELHRGPLGQRGGGALRPTEPSRPRWWTKK